MRDSRRFLRAKYTAPCRLTYDSVVYEAQLHDISTNGAMLGFSNSVMIPETEKCVLDIFPESQPPLHFEVEVVYSSFFTMGVKFTAMNDDVRARLVILVQGLLDAHHGNPPSD